MARAPRRAHTRCKRPLGLANHRLESGAHAGIARAFVIGPNRSWLPRIGSRQTKTHRGRFALERKTPPQKIGKPHGGAAVRTNTAMVCSKVLLAMALAGVLIGIGHGQGLGVCVGSLHLSADARVLLPPPLSSESSGTRASCEQ